MRILNLSKFRNAASLSSGRHASVFSGEGVEFWGLRSYSETDDSRSIDWKASLRSGKTLVKTFVPDREVPVWCVIDMSAPMGFWETGKTRFDQALSVYELLSASSLRSWNRFWAMSHAGNRFRVLQPTLSSSEIRRFAKVLRNDFESLAPETSISVPWPSVSRHVKMKSVVFFVSDLHPQFPLWIRKLLRRSHLFSLRIAHPYDENPPRFGFPAVFEGFFPKIIRWKSFPKKLENDADTHSPYSVPRTEIEIGKDPFPALNRLLSVPGA